MNLEQVFRKIFISDLNYDTAQQHLLVRGFNKTNSGISRHNHLDLKELDEFLSGKASMHGRPLSESDIQYIAKKDT